jgi:site-specific recombinase XerD
MKRTRTNHIALYCDNQRSPHTARNALCRLRAFARWLEVTYHVVDLERVGTAHILAYKLTLTHLAPSTQSRIMQTVRSFFGWCHEQGLIGTDPAATVKLPRALLGAEPAYLTTDDTRRLLGSVDAGSPYAARDHALLWALAYGLRAGEAVALDCADVLAAHDGRMPALRVTGKGTRQRLIPVCEAAFGALTTCSAGRSGPLFVGTYAGDRGRRLSVRAIEKRFSVAAARAGLPSVKAHPHAARHGAAQRWLFESSAPGGIYTVSRLLGHTRVSTTERYLRLDVGALEGAVMGDPLARGAEGRS